ncbi:hypothetical protein [Frankia sp. KB5]|uniref:hypothetical protein n=1 Tax=Frankia sp. KB5 TaxID=683318 RepID=UPI0012FF6B3A|nr:hypothetical protein [Frankia sp. KB5]
MYDAILEKKPAFFPFVSAEIFFEADASASTESLENLDVDVDLESELDELLRF